MAVTLIAVVGLAAIWTLQATFTQTPAAVPRWNLHKSQPPRWVTAKVEDIALPVVPVMARIGSKPTAEPRKSDALKLIESQAMSVLQLIALLDARAQAGDGEAACQIAHELNRCRGIRLMRESFEQTQIEGLAAMGLSNAEVEKRTAELVDTIAYNRQARDNCVGISNQHFQQIPRYYLIAARNGHFA